MKQKTDQISESDIVKYAYTSAIEKDDKSWRNEHREKWL